MITILSSVHLHNTRLQVTNYLVVTSDDDDTDTSGTAVLDGINYFFTWGIQHSHYTYESHVGLQENSRKINDWSKT